jgi:4-amino-4-deoxy-L-arabinose transferase-like glycosyltransferase
MTERAWAEIAPAAAADIHPPGYYWLLKAWTLLFGDSAGALRALSALSGVGVVALVHLIARQLAGGDGRWRWFPLAAAAVAALNPLQIYYGQEARMYMLLALAGCGLMAATLALLERRAEKRPPPGAAAAYVVAAAAGLWLHYSFPILLAAAGLGYLWIWRRQGRRWATLGWFILLNLLALAFFAPWLPTAMASILAWPKGGAAVELADGVALTLRTLLAGPLHRLPPPLWPWLAATAALPLLGIAALRRRPAAVLLSLWLLLPVGLMFGLGLFSDAFLKFLLAASPAWALLAAAAGWLLPERPVLRWLPPAFAAVVALLVLPGYYRDPVARDNYAGVARYLAAVGNPATDLVLLNAPGQGEVWRYYDPGLPVLGLPATRPADPAQVEAALTAATAGKKRIFALDWATDESDPAGTVAGWLGRNAFPGLSSWQGNLRFVTYAMAEGLHCTASNLRFGAAVTLTDFCLPEAEAVAPGDVAVVQLHWRSAAPPAGPLAVSVQLLNGQGQVIAQHDGVPGGGQRPVTGWQPGEVITDNHGLVIPPGIPPGEYQLAVVLYDPATGARLPTGGGEAADLGMLAVAPAVAPFPLDLLPVPRRLDTVMGPVTLVGAAWHKLGFDHAPETPVQTGDPLRVTLYWQAGDALLPADLQATVTVGDQPVTASLAPGYPTAGWPAGALVRGDFVVTFAGGDRTVAVEVGGERVELGEVP